MNADLEALLKAYDVFFQAAGPDARRLRELFESRLEDAAVRTGLSADKLREAIRRKYPRWVQANSRTTSLPPKA